MGLTGRVLSFGPAVNVMDFSYDISADSYRGARRDAYAFYTSSNSPSLPGDLATDENAKNWFTALLRSPTRIYLKPFMPCTLIADGAGL